MDSKASGTMYRILAEVKDTLTKCWACGYTVAIGTHCEACGEKN